MTDTARVARRPLVALSAIVVAGAGGAAFGAIPASAAPVSVTYTAAAAAPIAQITEDEPTSQFHPEGEGDYGYTLVSDNGSAASALATVMWPGSAAGNAGTLVALLGGPNSLSALNDPVQASAGTGATTSQAVSEPTGTTMSASVVPTGPDDNHTTATSATAGGGLGPTGTAGSSTSTSTIDFSSDTGVLSVTATAHASNLDVAGVVRIGSVTSSASAVADDGGTPTLTGLTNFHDMSIAGQEAYVDGSGVHLGAPGAPAGPAAVESADAALAAAGMEVYFTSPHAITVGGVSYYQAASVLFYWAPPGDSSHNSFTMSLGGSGVSVTDSPGGGDGADLFGGSASTTSFPATPTPTATALTPAVAPPPTSAAVAPVTGSTDASNPSVAPLSPLPPGRSGTTLSLPASPLDSSRTSGSAVPAAVSLPGGIGVGWWVLVALVALAGAGLTTRVPGLLTRQAAAECPRARHPRSHIGTDKETP